MKNKTISAIFKLAVLVLLLGLVTAELSAQVNTGDYTQVLLKTGYIVRGKVVEFTPGESITLQTVDGSTITYATSDIEAYGKGAKPKSGGSNSKSSGSQFNPDKLRLMAHLGLGTSGATKSDYDTKSVFKFPSLFGVGIKYNLDDMFSLHADLNLERKGYKISYTQKDYNGQTYPVSYKQKFTYLTIPLYAGVNFPYEDLIIFAQAGPYVGLLLKEKTDEGDYSHGHRSFDYGFLLAAGVEIPFNEQISLQGKLRYTRGVRKIMDDYYSYYQTMDNKIKNRSFSAVVSLVYKL